MDRAFALAVFFFGFAGALASAQPRSASAGATLRRAFLDQHCSVCHNDKLRTGGISMARLDAAHPGQTAELSEKVIRMLQAGMMPPAGMPRPDTASQKAFLSSLESAIDQAARCGTRILDTSPPPQPDRVRQFNP